MSGLQIEPHYLPSIEYFCLLSQVKKVVWPLDDPYRKQTYRNRCKILGAQGVQSLSIPVKCPTGAPMAVARIDYQQAWIKDHLRAVQTAYGKAPYFDHFWPFFEEIWQQKYPLLWELNHAMLSVCMQLLQWQIDITFTAPADSENFFLLKDRLNAKKSHEERSFYLPKPYIQVFGKGFVPCMSVIDLLMCTGPEAPEIIRISVAERL